MPLPLPEPGLVVSYEFLWAEEAESGIVEGQKARPCVLLSVRRDPKTGDTWTTVVPITHAPPADDDEALELPSPLKRHLRLDMERSWIVLTELNHFAWPGFDLRQLPGRGGEFVYGQLSPGFYRTLIAKLRQVSVRARLTNRR
jgi:hypothetical protein